MQVFKVITCNDEIRLELRDWSHCLKNNIVTLRRDH